MTQRYFIQQANTETMASGRSAIEDAPSPREYRSLLRAARDRVDEDFQLECLFIVRLTGELGLRAGELSHLKEHWVDFETQEIVIPSHEPCTKGQDGGPCGYCKKRAEEAAQANNSVSYEKSVVDRWKPKVEEGARRVWFGWNEDIFDLIDEYLSIHGEYPHSRVSVNRRVTRVADASDRVEKGDVYPAALRAHAAMLHAKKGVRAPHLKQYMGWSNVGPAMEYVDRASDDMLTEFKRAHQTPGNRV